MMLSSALMLSSGWCDMLMKTDGNTIKETLGLAAARLAGKGLLKPGDVLSQRIPERNAFLSVRIAAGQDVPETFEWASLAGGPQGLHHRVYASRPDVGAITSADLTWASMLARLDMSMPAIFDEQVRHLGVEAKRVAMRSSDDRAIAALANGANAYCLDDCTLCFGMGLERLLLNIEILEKCAESYVLAQCAAEPIRRIPWLVRFIANGRLKTDQKDAAARHLRGERSVMKAGY